MTTYTPARASFPAPRRDRYDGNDEAQFRSQLERSFAEVVAYVERLIGDGETVTPHVLATDTGLGAEHTMSGASAGEVLRATGATTAAWASLNFSDLAGSIADGQVPESAVTQHQAALSIAETQIPDGSILARVASAETITGLYTFSHASGLLTNVIGERTAAAGVTVDGLLIKDAGIPEAAVTAHQAALSISFTQMSDSIADAQVPESAVTQHEAALSIAFSQITGTVDADLLDGLDSTAFAAAEHVHAASDITQGTFQTGTYSFSGSTVVIGATNRLYLDGEGDTFIRERVANEIEMFVGGAGRVRFSDSLMTVFTNAQFDGSLSNGAGVTIADGTASITIDGTDGAIAAGSKGLFEAGGTFFMSSRGSIVMLIDNDNNSTSEIFQVIANVASGGTSVFSVGETGVTVIGSDPGGFEQLRVGGSIRWTAAATHHGTLSSINDTILQRSGVTKLTLGASSATFVAGLPVAIQGTLTSRSIAAEADSTYDIGADATRFATGYFDAIDATQITGTLQTAAQTNVTSVGTLVALTVSGALTLGDGGQIDSAFEDNASSGTLNNYDPGSDRVIVLFTSASAKTLTGLVAGSDGQRLLIGVGGGGALQVNHQDAGSSVSNRFVMKSGANTTVSTFASFVYYNIAGQARWYET